MTEQRDGPLVPVHPLVTKAVDAYPSVAAAVTEFFFEATKRATLIVGLQLAAIATHSTALAGFATLSTWMLGLWAALRLNAPLRAWMWNLTLEEKRDSKNELRFWIGNAVCISAGICFAALTASVIGSLEFAANLKCTVH
ncbi:MAG: hypothetical protein P4M09_12985 [Devosia sp.]|nr:hypothetical protein [Devosia sp.]